MARLSKARTYRSALLCSAILACLPATAADKPVDYTSTVAVVNGEKITRGDLAEALILASGHRALTVMVKRRLIHQEAARLGITATEQEIVQGIKERIDEMIQDEMRSAGYEDMESFAKYLSKGNMTLDKLKERAWGGLSPDIYAETEAVVKAVKLINAKVKVTEEDVKAQYDRMYGPRVTASQIVVKKRREAEEVRQKLSMGADFARLARAHSIDRGSAARGGMMAKSIVPADGALWTAVQTLKKGQISQITRSQKRKKILG